MNKHVDLGRLLLPIALVSLLAGCPLRITSYHAYRASTAPGVYRLRVQELATPHGAAPVLGCVPG